MKYYNIKSVFQSGKTPINPVKALESFNIPDTRKAPFIEPRFGKVIFESEKPTVILVSAVGATGKSALASVLAYDTQSPALDLAKHKPVGANSLTGLITDAYDHAVVGDVLSGLASGVHGMIIDGLDEGRAKTTEAAFQAFLDDVVKFSKSSKRTTFVMLGRAQVAEDCWTYLSEKGLDVGLVTIDAFDLESARAYIDAYTGGHEAAYKEQYVAVRDKLLTLLSAAFGGDDGPRDEHGFLAFIGYPPVLDAIVALLKTQPNFHKLMQELDAENWDNREIEMLLQIAKFILNRERTEKVVPAIVDPVLAGIPEVDAGRMRGRAFTDEEQAFRLLAHCLCEESRWNPFDDQNLDADYEERIGGFLQEHPFLDGRKFRNAVFESACVGYAMVSSSPQLMELGLRYVEKSKRSYLLLLFAPELAAGGKLPSGYLGALVESAMELRSVRSLVEVHVSGGLDAFDDKMTQGPQDVGVEVKIYMSGDQASTRTIEVASEVEPDDRVVIGPRIGGTFFNLPCSIVLKGCPELELVSPVDIEGREIEFDCRSVVVRRPRENVSDEVRIAGKSLRGLPERVEVAGTSFIVETSRGETVGYPLVSYLQYLSNPALEGELLVRFFRIKRILQEFRSHSKGSMAKFQDKIEHERVLKDEVGRAVLDQLCSDDVLVLKGRMYHLEMDRLADLIGVNWTGLRKGEQPQKLQEYLARIRVE